MTTEPFRTIVADPPWPFEDHLPGKGRGAAKHYVTMKLQELMAMPMPPIAADATLYLWRVSAMPEEALMLLKAWGFTYKTEMVWVKTTQWPAAKYNPDKNEIMAKIAIGMGRIVRGSHEPCVVATRGRPKTLNKGVSSVLFAPRGEHSEKPQRFYDLVEKLSPGPYLELFSRRQRNGWTCLGDEVTKFMPAMEV